MNQFCRQRLLFETKLSAIENRLFIIKMVLLQTGIVWLPIGTGGCIGDQLSPVDETIPFQAGHGSPLLWLPPFWGVGNWFRGVEPPQEPEESPAALLFMKPPPVSGGGQLLERPRERCCSSSSSCWRKIFCSNSRLRSSFMRFRLETPVLNHFLDDIQQPETKFLMQTCSFHNRTTMWRQN